MIDVLRQFIGWLSADIPELHHVEVPRLAESLDRFLAHPDIAAVSCVNQQPLRAELETLIEQWRKDSQWACGTFQDYKGRSSCSDCGEPQWMHERKARADQLTALLIRSQQREREDHEVVARGQEVPTRPTGSTAAGNEAVRDQHGFVLCHHGRPITCLECGEEYARGL